MIVNSVTKKIFIIAGLIFIGSDSLFSQELLINHDTIKTKIKNESFNYYKAKRKISGKIKYLGKEDFRGHYFGYLFLDDSEVNYYNQFGDLVSSLNIKGNGKQRSTIHYFRQNPKSLNHIRTYEALNDNSVAYFNLTKSITFTENDSVIITLDSSFNRYGELENIYYRRQILGGNRIISIVSEANGQMRELVIDEYNENRQRLKSEYYSKDSSLKHTRFRITDSLGRSNLFFTIDNGDTVSKYFQQLDTNGLIIFQKESQKELNHSKELYISYEFDAYGNWTRKLIYDHRKKLTHVVTRNLIYWE